MRQQSCVTPGFHFGKLQVKDSLFYFTHLNITLTFNVMKFGFITENILKNAISILFKDEQDSFKPTQCFSKLFNIFMTLDILASSFLGKVVSHFQESVYFCKNLIIYTPIFTGKHY